MAGQDLVLALRALLDELDALPGLHDVGETVGRCDVVADLRDGLQVVEDEYRVAAADVLAACGVDFHRLVSDGMAGCLKDAYAGHDFRLTVHEVHLDALERAGDAQLGRFVGFIVQRDRIHGEAVFFFVDIEFRVREFLHVEAVIPVEMRKDHDINVFRFVADLLQLLDDGHPFRLTGAVMVVFAGTFRISHACIDKEELVPALYEIRVYGVLFFDIGGVRIKGNRGMMVEVLLGDHRHKTGVDGANRQLAQFKSLQCVQIRFLAYTKCILYPISHIQLIFITRYLICQ